MITVAELKANVRKNQSIFEGSSLKAFMEADYETQVLMAMADHNADRWRGIYCPEHHVNPKFATRFMRIVDDDDFTVSLPIERHIAMHLTLFSQSLMIAKETGEDIPTYWFWANITPISKYAQVYTEMYFPGKPELRMEHFKDPYPKVKNGVKTYTEYEWKQYLDTVMHTVDREPEFLKYLIEWAYKYSKDCPVELDEFPGASTPGQLAWKVNLNKKRKAWFSAMYEDMFR